MRFVNRLLAAVLGLLLLVGGVLVAVEILLAGLQQDPVLIPWAQWAESTRTTAWATPVVRTISLLVLLGGLLLLFAQLRRGRPRALPLHGNDELDAEVDRRSLERSLERAAEEVDGVTGAKARCGSRKIDLTADTTRSRFEEVREAVSRAADERIATVGLATRPAVTVDVRRAGHR